MTIVSVEELRDYMSSIRLTADQQQAAELVIAGVQAEVEGYLGRAITRGTYVEQVLTDFDGRIWLRNTPVLSITSVEYNGALAALGAYVWEAGQLYYGTTPGLPVTVTYVGGIDGANVPAIRMTVLRVAAREMQNRHDDALSVKDLTVTDDAPEPEGLQDDDRRRIDRWRKRVMA